LDDVLVVHTEVRKLPVYTLVKAKGGPKLKEAKDGMSSMSSGRAHLSGNMSTSELARYLVPILGRTVLDQTGMHGLFEVKLEWVPELDANMPSDSSASSIFTSIQEQLGLRLRSTTGPVEVLVVDRAEKVREQ